MDILRLEAERIAIEIGAVLHPGRCVCGWPLLEMRNQMAFCVNCIRNLQMIQKTYDLLDRLVHKISIVHIGNETFIKEKGQAA